MNLKSPLNQWLLTLYNKIIKTENACIHMMHNNMRKYKWLDIQENDQIIINIKPREHNHTSI